MPVIRRIIWDDYLKKATALRALPAYEFTVNAYSKPFNQHLFTTLRSAPKSLNHSIMISLFPNPATGLLHVDIDDPAAVTYPFYYRIYNSLGMPVLDGLSFNKHLEIDVATLPCGVYFVKAGVDPDTASVVKSFVK